MTSLEFDTAEVFEPLLACAILDGEPIYDEEFEELVKTYGFGDEEYLWKIVDIEDGEKDHPLYDRLIRIRTRAIFGGRGGAKSRFFGTTLIERCMLKRTRWACLREIQKSIAFSVKQLLEDTIERHDLWHLFESKKDRIEGPNDSIIIFQGLQNHTVDTIKSLEDFDGAWIEEAQTISQFSLKILRPTLRKEGSELWYSWNPRHREDAVEFLRYDTPRDCIIVESQYYNNPWLPKTLRAEKDYDKGRDIDTYNHVWLGQYEQNSELRIIKNWRIEEFEAERGTIFKLGADWGYAIDPTVLIRCFIVGKELYIDYEAYQHECDIDNIPLLFSQVPDSHLYPIIADSSRPETIAYVRKNGYPKIYSSAKGSGSVKDGIEFLKSYSIVVHPRCEMTIKELTNYKYKADPDSGLPTGVPEDKENHVIDALRYACESARKKKQTQRKASKIQPIRNHW